MSKREYAFIQWGVDVGKYNTRLIKSYFHGASDELATLVLNFCLFPELAIIKDANWYSGSGASYARAEAALDLLRESGLIKVALNYGVHIGRARVWRQTARFDELFRIKVGKRLLVKEELLSSVAAPTL